MKRRMLALMAAVLLLCVSAQAAILSVRASVDLSFSGTTANCYSYVKSTNSGDSLSVTMTLMQGDTVIRSWSKSGTGSVKLEKSCTVKSGVTYELVCSCSVNGGATKTAVDSGTCP